MMEENDIFLVGGDALMHLAEPVHKTYYTKFVWSHSFSTYASYNQFFNSLSPSSPTPLPHILHEPPPSYMAYFSTKP